MKFHLKGVELQWKQVSFSNIPQHNKYRLLDYCSRGNADKGDLFPRGLGSAKFAVALAGIQ